MQAAPALLAVPGNRHDVSPAPKAEAAEGRVLRKRSEFLANFQQNAKIRHVVVGILPCVILTRLNQDVNMAKNANSDTMMLGRRPAVEERQCQRISCFTEKKVQIVVVYLKIPIR